MVKEWSLNMTDNKFDLEVALAKLHEEDWLHPDQAAFQDKTTIQELANEKKYHQKNYWVAQFSHLLIDQFQQSTRACSRILQLPNHATVVRALKDYPICDYQSITEIQTALDQYYQQQGGK